MSDRHTPAAIEITASETRYCEFCGKDLPGPTVRVVDIAQVRVGWIAQGEMRTASCPGFGCSGIYSQLVRYIPVECASFPCPSCGTVSELTTEILSITKAKMGYYSFAALLKCDACSKQSRFSKLLGALSKITKVKVGPTGVEVEVKS